MLVLSAAHHYGTGAVQSTLPPAAAGAALAPERSHSEFTDSLSDCAFIVVSSAFTQKIELLHRALNWHAAISIAASTALAPGKQLTLITVSRRIDGLRCACIAVGSTMTHHIDMLQERICGRHPMPRLMHMQRIAER